MRKITIIMNEETQEKFQYILQSHGRRSNYSKIPTYKEVMLEAMELLYQKEKRINAKNKESCGIR